MAPNPWTPGLFKPNGRSIGGIIAQVTISEREHDELFITEHPIEQGAPISDHAFKRPSEVGIRAGWSAAVAGDLSANGNGVYGLLLSWQAALHPFDLYTGKRVYHDMLIQSLIVTTDQTSEFALMADITCRQVILVRTQTAQASISSDNNSQTSPESTSTSQNHGEQQTRNVGSGSAVDANVPEEFSTTQEPTTTSGDTNVPEEFSSEGQKVEQQVISNQAPVEKLGPVVASAPIPPT